MLCITLLPASFIVQFWWTCFLVRVVNWLLGLIFSLYLACSIRQQIFRPALWKYIWNCVAFTRSFLSSRQQKQFQQQRCNSDVNSGICLNVVQAPCWPPRRVLQSFVLDFFSYLYFLLHCSLLYCLISSFVIC